MAAQRKASSDEVGLAMLEQLIKAGGRKRVMELVAPEEADETAEDTESEELDLDELEALANAKG